MLELTNITKDYVSGDTTVKALKGVSIKFRKNEFVSILGQSGCGKTTLLNIIGGLDRYTDGDLSIDDISTKKYKDKDWDTYRNNRIGFVFQSYNLIPHQTVLSNVELALTLSGVSKSERRKRAIEVLEKVGLGDQIHKKPNQMSGGQMQRVAIARALVNNPDILLADEPTGALDSATSIQIMNILKDISKDKLIIMVTHNPELADKYSSRIIRLLDGKVVDDTNPYNGEESEDDKATDKQAAKNNKSDEKVKKAKKQKTSMSFITALSLSLNNLMTKKARTILTAFAGSIGIIGIALILSLSHGMRSYIHRVEQDTLSGYPLTIQKTAVDYSSFLGSFLGLGEEKKIEDKQPGRVYSNSMMSDMINKMLTSVTVNDLKSFMSYIESDEFTNIFWENKNLKNRILTNYFSLNSFKKIVDYRYELIPCLQESYDVSYKNTILDLLPQYETELAKYSNNNLEKNIRNKNKYKTFKKNAFSWRGYWSNRENFFCENPNFKYKLINHYTKNFMKPLLVPILDISYYLPEFSGFNKKNLFRKELPENKINLDIDKVLKSSENYSEENIKEKNKEKKKENYLVNIYKKSNLTLYEKYEKIANNLEFGKEEEFAYIERDTNKNKTQEENKENPQKYFLSCLVKTSHHIKGVCFIDDNNLNFKV